MSSPPRCVPPFVETTSTTLSPTSRTEISNLPPPLSNTAMCCSLVLSRPYASAAAVGSLMMRLTSRPAILPASFVAWRCESLKYGDGDDRFGHRLAQILLGRTLQLHQHARPDLRRRVALAADLEGRIAVRGRDDLERDALGLFLRVSVGELAADETLAREHGVLGVGDCLTASDVTYEDFALLVESDHRRGQARARLVCDDLRLLALHDRDHGVRGAKVDADDLALVCFFL